MDDFFLAWAGPGDLAAACRVLFPHDSASQNRARLGCLQALAGNHLRIAAAFSRGRLVGAMMTRIAAGATGMIWLPRALRDHAAAAEIRRQLVAYVLNWLHGEGARVCQALLDRAEDGQSLPLLENHFQRLGRLLFLRLEADQFAAALAIPRTLSFLPYEEALRPAFEQTIRRTYVDSHDCPELNEIRPMDEVLESHQGQGIHHPDGWFLAREGKEIVGVLLLCEEPEWDAWEISYMGVVPEARGRGYGRQLAAQAVAEVQQRGAMRLALTVDERNEPGRRIYLQLGFRSWNERFVYLHIRETPDS